MRTVDMKKILAQKLEEEGTYFRYDDISIKKDKMPLNKWIEEKDDYGVEMVEAYKIVIKEYEHIHFFLTKSHDFSQEINLWRKNFDTASGEYEDKSILIDYDEGEDVDKLTSSELIHLGYYIGQRF